MEQNTQFTILFSFATLFKSPDQSVILMMPKQRYNCKKLQAQGRKNKGLSYKKYKWIDTKATSDHF